MKNIVIAAVAASLLTSVAFAQEHKAEKHEKHWDYSQNGPTHWGEFSKTCAKGNAQSPINIVPGKSVHLNAQYKLHLHEDIHTTAKVIDNGHSIKVTPKEGGTIELHGEKFKLLQFHFHGKSEHTIDGKRYDMVAHLVHQNPKTKQLAVIAVFFEEGKNHPVLDNVLNGLASGSEIRIDPADLLPEDTSHYFHYVGSLTTPPCSENVQWYLLKQPAKASKYQIHAFREFYVDNERPIQELHDRTIEAE